jgi:hypothetical protein
VKTLREYVHSRLSERIKQASTSEDTHNRINIQALSSSIRSSWIEIPIFCYEDAIRTPQQIVVSTFRQTLVHNILITNRYKLPSLETI